MVGDPEHWAVFVVSPDGHAAAGFIEVHLRELAEGARGSPVPFVEGWFVAAGQRRRGLGRVLLEAAENWARSRGFSELGSDTQLSNDLSIEVHQRLGFDEAERLVCFLKQLNV